MNYNDFTDMEYLEKIYILQASDKDNRGGRTLNNARNHVLWMKREIFKNKNSLKILDLGCGIGHYTRELADLGYNCTGVDISSYAIEYAKSLAKKNPLCNFIHSDILSYPFSESYDVVIFPYSIFNIFNKKDRENLLNKIFYCLNENGLFYFEVINIQKPSKKHEHLAYLSSDEFCCNKEHILLIDREWNKNQKKIKDKYFYIDKDNYAVSAHAGEIYAYSQKDINKLLLKIGFCNINFHDTPPGADQDIDMQYFFITANRPKTTEAERVDRRNFTASRSQNGT